MDGGWKSWRGKRGRGVTGWGLATAVRTLTIIPFPGKESESGATGFYWYVPVGALLGGILYFVSKINLPTPLLATLIVALLALLTRAFHLDGLADTFDGFGGGNSKERRLEIMRDHQTGVFGVTALLLTLIFKVVATTLLLEGGRGAFIFYAPLLSRFFVVAQALFNPYARESGKAFSQINDGKLRHLLVSFGWVLLSLLLFPSHLWEVAILFGVGLVVTLLIALRARSLIGGVTGDVLGATVELSETLILCVATLAILG
jgi:adenosylcobinamide-GDP ribazoletransferase